MKELTVLLDASTIVESLIAFRTRHYTEAVATLVESMVLYDAVTYDPHVDWRILESKQSKLLEEIVRPCPIEGALHESILGDLARIVVHCCQMWNAPDGTTDIVSDIRRTRARDWRSPRLSARLLELFGETNSAQILELPHLHIIGYDMFHHRVSEKSKDDHSQSSQNVDWAMRAYKALLLPYLRIGYYAMAAQALDLQYCPHPNRVEIITYLRGGETDKYPPPDFPKAILDYLDDKVRKQLIEKVQMVFQIPKSMLKVPPLYEYVESQATSAEQILELAIDLRESDRARAYRAHCRAVRDAYISGDIGRLAGFTQEIMDIAQDWSQSLLGQKKTKTINVSLGLFATDLHIPDLRLDYRKKHMLLLHDVISRLDVDKDYSKQIWIH